MRYRRSAVRRESSRKKRPEHMFPAPLGILFDRKEKEETGLKRSPWIPYLASLLAAFAAGGLGAFATSTGMEAYKLLQKPPGTPPSLVFPIVWSLLYSLMGGGASRVWNTGDQRRGRALSFYVMQLLLNSLWSILFFGLQARFLALVCLIVLWILIFAMARWFHAIDPIAGKLQIPYLLWVAYAGYLNIGILVLNP